MRLNMHRETPGTARISDRAEKALLTSAYGFLCAPFLIAAVYLVYRGDVLIGMMIFLMAALLCAAGVHFYMWEMRSCVEICGEEITAVEYIWGRPDVIRFQKSQIGSACYSAVRHGR